MRPDQSLIEENSMTQAEQARQDISLPRAECVRSAKTGVQEGRVSTLLASIDRSVKITKILTFFAVISLIGFLVGVVAVLASHN
jgi:hypothetical protein